MTKERPIGLIVGLLLIIGFGLILSMLMGTEDKLPPPSAAAEENPGAYASVYAIDDSARFTPVLNGADLSTAVAGGGLGGNSMVESRMAEPNLDERGGVISELRPGTSVLAATGLPDGGVAPPRGANPIFAEASHRTFTVTPDGGLRAGYPEARTGVAPEAGRGQTYVVETGDTLTRIARKIYGQGKDHEYKRIYEANRGVLRSESDLSVGQELIIPPLPTPVSASASAPLDVASGRLAAASADRAGSTARAPGRAGPGRYVTATMDDLSGTLATMSRGPAPAAGRSYVIQRGDSLTSVARRLMNDDSPAAVARLYEANRGVLPSRDRLRIGVQLKLP